MSRKTRSRDDWKRLSKFEQENEKLRKEVSKLRKQTRSVFIDKLEQRANRIDNGQPAILLTCENCGNHEVEIVDIKRLDGDFEIRICKSCEHRSEMKKIRKKSKD